MRLIYVLYLLASSLGLSFQMQLASWSWTNHQPVLGGPSEMDNCQARWLVYDGVNPLKGVSKTGMVHNTVGLLDAEKVCCAFAGF